MSKLTMLRNVICLILPFLSGCLGTPEGIKVVDGFELERYLGQWYEIARLDHSFERGLSKVTAEYTIRPQGGITVVNSGYDKKSDSWKEANGKAFFVGEPTIGKLKVSFFGPFYGGYNIIELDKENYQYAVICGPNKSYLWILAREKVIAPELKDRLVAVAQNAGFAVDKLIWVEQ